MAWIKQMAALSLVAACGCKQRAEGSKLDASPEGRKIIGIAPEYEAEALVESELETSMKERRAEAWRIVARTLKGVPLALADRIEEPEGGAAKELRLWQTWYQSDEFNVLFRELYKGLGKDGRKAKRGFGASAIDAKIAWLAERPVDDFAWTEERFDRRLKNVKTADDVNGIPGTDGMAGRGMTFFSPALVKHVLGNYGQVLGCGPGLATLAANKDFGEGKPFTPCFGAEFPKTSVAIKTAWLPAKNGVPRYATGADALKATLASGEWRPVQEPPASMPQPTAREIYTMRARPSVSGVGPAFRLAGLHIVTKETRHWMWVSLWWSDKPNEDFGADRPEEIGEIGSAWANYKMCVTSSYDEKDEAPWKWYEDSHPSLAAALKASAQGTKHTWCSNPYIEKGVGNARTNCIGCHQHAGARIDSDSVFADEARYPDAGRGKQRANFPGDYLWAFDAGNDMLEPGIVAETARQDAAD